MIDIDSVGSLRARLKGNFPHAFPLLAGGNGRRWGNAPIRSPVGCGDWWVPPWWLGTLGPVGDVPYLLAAAAVAVNARIGRMPWVR
jgi:hypothetical protein